jgi:hypothetical protein
LEKLFDVESGGLAEVSESSFDLRKKKEKFLNKLFLFYFIFHGKKYI